MNRTIGRLILCAVSAATALLACACTAPRPNYVVTDPDPGVKIPAIKMAVAKHDEQTATLRQLITDLESDDAAVRFYAIEGLERLTGQDFGYVFYEDAEVRKPAVQRWTNWLAEREGKRASSPDPVTATRASE